MTSLCIMQIWRNLVTWTVLLQGPQCKYVLDFIVLSLIFSWFLHALIHKLESEILHCIILILMYSAYTNTNKTQEKSGHKFIVCSYHYVC